MENIKALLLKHLKRELNSAEKAVLDEWLALSEDNRAILSEISDTASIAGNLEKMDRFDEEGAWEKVVAYRSQAVSPAGESLKNEQQPELLPGKPRLFLLKRRLTYAAAAAVIVLFIGGGMMLYKRLSPQRNPIAIRNEIHTDITPGKDRAVLTLGDGRKILLDSNSTGAIARQGEGEVVNAKGSLNYTRELNAGGKRIGPAEVMYNTVETGRGNQYQLILSDGSKVWLNAASSLRYPVSFTGSQRRVELTGEGYFSIAKETQRPFIVSFDHTDVKVLGTEFNVMAYSDEPGGTRTTLITGSVSIVRGRGQMKLEPGKMAVVDDAGIRIKSNEDIEQVIAWKNGQISLNNADLKLVMRQISRWYDVDVKYEGPVVPKHFGGLLDRNVNLSAVLDFLAENGVHTRVKGREIIVLK